MTHLLNRLLFSPYNLIAIVYLSTLGSLEFTTDDD
jgi:hypothetical protein